MKDERVYLLHVLDSMVRIMDYTRGGKKAFLGDTKTQDAVVRNLEIIGEAVKNMSSSLKSKYPDIPWKRMAGMRDKMIHDYFGVNLDIVWDVVERDIPVLKRGIEAILKTL
ncbi:MAG: DUF86 domain-containing protein [Nitrospinae bacterium]|nr:DUF86 domain-containing protein [Nitrospinota bacterium]